MRLGLTSIFVDDQEEAMRFYTEKLGFVLHTDVPAGEYRWITVISPAQPDGMQLVLEPNAHPAARAYQAAIYADGIPATLFFSVDVQLEYEELVAQGVHFKSAPEDAGYGKQAVFDDTCGNWILLMQG